MWHLRHEEILRSAIDITEIPIDWLSGSSSGVLLFPDRRDCSCDPPDDESRGNEDSEAM